MYRFSLSSPKAQSKYSVFAPGRNGICEAEIFSMASKRAAGVPLDDSKVVSKERKVLGPVVSHETWLNARRELLEEEKRLSRATLKVAEHRRKMPWEAVTKTYTFVDCDGKNVDFGSLFGSRSTLCVQHLMFDPSWANGCPTCSCWVDGLNGSLPHIQSRVELIVVAKAPYAKLAEFVKAKGWKIPAFSSHNTSFNRDFRVEFSKDEQARKLYNFSTSSWTHSSQAPGFSVFYKGADGAIYRTYSAFGPGLVPLNVMFALLDMTPDGRAEKNRSNMWWVKHKEKYASDQSE